MRTFTPANRESPAIRTFWKYRHIFLAYRWSIAVGLLVLLATNTVSVLIPVQVQRVIDDIAAGELDSLAPALGIILALAAVMLGCRIASRWLLFGVGRKVEYALRNALYRHLLTLPPAYYSVHPTGELMSRMINDVQALRFLFGGGITLGFNTLFAYALSLPVMLHYSPRLTLFAFLVLPVAVYLMSLVSGRVKRHYFRVQEVLGDVSSVAQENFSGMAVIQSYVKEQTEDRRFSDISDRYYREYLKLIKMRVWLFLIMALVTSLGILIVLAEGGREYILGLISPGAFVAFVMLLEKLSWPTAAMGWTVTMIQQGTAAMERLDQVLSAKSNLTRPDQKTHDSRFPTGPLEIRDLTFHYDNPYGDAHLIHPPVLHHVSLKIEPGETVVIVGGVGAGKSTLLSLIPKLYPVPDGKVFIGGRDINTMPLPGLRELVTFMPQHSFLFSTDIRRNIAYGQPEAGMELITEVAETAAVHKEVMAFDTRYETLVGERGITLSGGQRQRMTLARAILIEPRILLLDDPFSNVDAHTEEDIIRALAERKVFENKITLIATHRLSVIRHADRVVLMDEGRIVATGSHDELMAEQPLYQRLHRLEHLRAELDAVWRDSLPETEEPV